MQVFIDESGDSGFKFEHGSSRFFTVGLVIFQDANEVVKCYKAISDLKEKLGWSDLDEFHFKRNSDKVRRTFLRTVSKYDFIYYAMSMDKSLLKYASNEFHNKEYVYMHVHGLIFERAKEKLTQADVFVDISGNQDFRNSLFKPIRRNMNDDRKRIKKIRMQRSESNNLLQLADYVASIVNRSLMRDKLTSDEYRNILKSKEVAVEII